jgi:hypothetical protein
MKMVKLNNEFISNRRIIYDGNEEYTIHGYEYDEDHIIDDDNIEYRVPEVYFESIDMYLKWEKDPEWVEEFFDHKKYEDMFKTEHMMYRELMKLTFVDYRILRTLKFQAEQTQIRNDRLRLMASVYDNPEYDEFDLLDDISEDFITLNIY